MNYGFFDAANENHQATLLFDSAAAVTLGSRSLHPSAIQLDGMEVSTYTTLFCCERAVGSRCTLAACTEWCRLSGY